MTRRPRDYAPHLRTFWARRFPDRPNPAQKEFSDEVLAAVDLIMYQIDPSGEKPVLLPPGYADGIDPEPTARPSGRRRGPE